MPKTLIEKNITREEYPDLTDIEFEKLECSEMSYEEKLPDDLRVTSDEKDLLSSKSTGYIEITQDCSYGWTIDSVNKFLDGWSAVMKYAYILHDKDHKEDGSPRNPHIHLLIKFVSRSYPWSAIIARAKAVALPDDCITPNRLQKVKGWAAALNYLTHRDEHLFYKHVYDSSEVISNFDWQLECEKYHSEKDLKTSNLREKEIIEGIFSGTIKEYNLDKFMSNYEIVKYDSSIAKAFKHVTLKSFKEERNMEVMFVTGPSGVGKDTFAVDWAQKNGLDYYRTNNNPDTPFDNYRGEPVIIWSDARDDIMKPHNLHQLLDNHYSSMQKSRYHDKYIAAKYLIITSIKPIEEWYSQFYRKESEDITQLYRRVHTVFIMSADVVKIKVFNQKTNSYDMLPLEIPNTFSHDADYLDTTEKQLDFAKKLLGGMSDTCKMLADNFESYISSSSSADTEGFVPCGSDNPFASPVINKGK